MKSETMHKPKILILDDNSADAELVRRELRKAGVDFTAEWAPDKAAFLRSLEEFAPDLILADYSLPGFDGMAALGLARQRFADIPVVIVSGAIGEEVAVDTLKAGATDYVLKTRLSRLGPVVKRALSEAAQLAERKHAEQALRESEERFRLLVEAVKDYAIFFLDKEGRVVTWNRGAELLKGYSADEIIGRHFSCFYTPDDVAQDKPSRCLSLAIENGRYAEEGRRVRKDGSIFWADTTITALYDEQGNLQGFVKIVRDISERRKAEEILNRTKEELERFNASLADSRRAALNLAEDELKSRRQAESLNIKLKREINERKRAEEELRQTTDYLEKLFNYANAPIICWDAELKITRFNRAFENLTGYKAAEVIGCKLDMLFPEDTRQASLENIRRTLTEFWEVVEVPILRKDGGVRIALWNSANIYGEDGKTIIATIAQGQDITERKQAEEDLRQSEARLKATLRSTVDEVWIADTQGRIISISDSITESLGVRPDKWADVEAALGDLEVRRPDGTVRPREDTILYRALRGEVIANEQERIRNLTTGRVHWREVSSAPIRDADGRIIGAVAVARDITERREAEEERKRLLKQIEEKNKELQSIVYTASHDLRSPLLNIYGFSGQLSEQVEALQKIMDEAGDIGEARQKAKGIFEKELPENLAFIRAGAEKMQMLINGLLTMSRIGTVPLRIQIIDMNELFRRIADAVSYEAKEKGVEIDVRDLPPCKGDAAQINQLFSNIVNNALKYLDPKRKGQIHITGRRDGDMNVYSVCDNGIGIAPEHKERIFEIFHRLNPKDGVAGEGLGLSIVLRIADRHNGRVWVDSTPGRGSTFHVALPGDK